MLTTNENGSCFTINSRVGVLPGAGIFPSASVVVRICKFGRFGLTSGDNGFTNIMFNVGNLVHGAHRVGAAGIGDNN